MKELVSSERVFLESPVHMIFQDEEYMNLKKHMPGVFIEKWDTRHK